MKRSLNYIVFLACLMSLTPLYASTYTTYYPAPQGNYLNMSITDEITFTSNQPGTLGFVTPPCSVGALNASDYLIDINGVLNVCDSKGQLTPFSNALWTPGDATDTWIYPAIWQQNVGIGTTSIPTDPLDVAGNIGIGPVNFAYSTAGSIIRSNVDNGQFFAFSSHTPTKGAYMILNSSSYASSPGHLILTHGDYTQPAPASKFRVRYANNGTVTDQLDIDSNGNVGIGQPTPVATLQVGNGGVVTGPTTSLFVASNLNGASVFAPEQGAWIEWNAEASTNGMTDFINNEGLGTGGWKFYNTDRLGNFLDAPMTIQGGGNVGIGTINPNPGGILSWYPDLTIGPQGNNNASTLELVSNGTVDSGIGSSGIGVIAFRNSAIAAPEDNRIAQFQIDHVGLDGGAISFFTHQPGGSMGNQLTIRESGRIGINNPNPQFPLDVIGGGGINIDMHVAGRIMTGDAGNQGGIWLNNPNTLFVGEDVGPSSNVTDIGLYTANPGYSVVVSSLTGNVGIGGGGDGWGDISPGAALEVVGNNHVGGPGGTVTIGGSPPPAVVQNTSNLTGATVPNVTVCQTAFNGVAQSCGYLALGQASDGNFYAIYGP